MFRTDLLSIIRCLSTVFTAIGVCRTSYGDSMLMSIIRSLSTVFTAIGVCRTSYGDSLLAKPGPR